MPQAAQTLLTLAPPLLSLIALALLVRRGSLSATAFDSAPPRRVGFDHWVPRLLVASYVLLLLLNAAAMLTAGSAQTQPATAAIATPEEVARRALTGQAVALLPLAGFAIFAAAQREDGLGQLGILPRPFGAAARAGLLALLAAEPMVLTATSVAQYVAARFGHTPPALAHDLLGPMVGPGHIPARLALVASSVLVAPVLEEVIFRGLVQTALLDLLGRRRRWLVVFAAGIVFVLVHIGSVWAYALPALFVLSLFLGWLYERTGNLWPGIVLHAGFNAFNVALAMAGAGGA